MAVLGALLSVCPAVPASASAGSSVKYAPARIKPPPVYREFRGVWVATVKNIDWPSRAGLSSAQQQAELIGLLDRVRQLNCNAIILQVRPACDALYASGLEPWSEYLSGQMGRGPQPPYDPLAFAIQEAHQRGLDLHVWFNPYRARHGAAKGPAARNHVSRTMPSLVHKYADALWLDPGSQAVESHTLNVIMDVVRRYDIDGVHLDDYFYPYPKQSASGRPIPFPDQASWNQYRQGGGTLDRAAWRRSNVNRLILRLSQSIKKEKPWVLFGVSPFGIWKSGYPASVRGLSGLDDLHADSALWLRKGWVDYLTPQLYWSTQAPRQRFGDLLDWWVSQNKQPRHLWPGLSLFEPGSEADRSPTETLRQISLVRNSKGAGGMAFYSARSLVQNRRDMASILARQALQHPVLIPPSSWIDAQPPVRPAVQAAVNGQGELIISWQNADQRTVKHWVLQARINGTWTTRFLPGNYRSVKWPDRSYPDVICISAVDRANNLGGATALQLTGASG